MNHVDYENLHFAQYIKNCDSVKARKAVNHSSTDGHRSDPVSVHHIIFLKQDEQSKVHRTRVLSFYSPLFL